MYSKKVTYNRKKKFNTYLGVIEKDLNKGFSFLQATKKNNIDRNLITRLMDKEDRIKLLEMCYLNANLKTKNGFRVKELREYINTLYENEYYYQMI